MVTVSILDDPLLALRQSITTNSPPILASSTTPLGGNDPQPTIAQATHIQFNFGGSTRTYEFSTPTRFAPAPDADPVNLRSIYFTWLNKDASLPDYIAAVQQLNEELSGPGGAGGTVQNLAFAQKVELIAWLAGESDSSEYIKPIEGGAASVAVDPAVPAAAATQNGAVAGKAAGEVDPRLLEIYQGERLMGDHNTALRGSRPTVRT